MVGLMQDARYIGGHPMAGSELEGVDGARADLFEGATWVLTPVEVTDDTALSRVRSIVSSFGAEVVALAPERHDTMVALVSHVPHLTAATLMRLADERSTEQRALLRLAAGGFRDMTRIAAGHPGIWPDICVENRVAIVAELDELIGALSEMREVVDKGELARITTLATDLDVSIADLEIAHSAEGQEGVVIILVEAALAHGFVEGLTAAGFKPSWRALQ
jgi:prephenate dehydrogenase